MVWISLLLGLLFRAQAADRAINFDTGGGPVEVPNFQLAGVSDEVTVEFWANLNHPYSQPVFTLEPNDNEANRFQGQLAYRNGTTMFQCGTASVSADPIKLQKALMEKWNHFAFVASASGNYLRIYVNGKLMAESTLDTHTLFNPTLGSYTLRIGGKDAWDNFTGHIDEFRIWNVARTHAQIMGNMILPPLADEPDLRLYYKFDEDDPPYYTTDAKAINSATVTGAAFHGTMLYKDDEHTPPYARRWTAPARVHYVVTATEENSPYLPGNPASLEGAIYEASSQEQAVLITFAPAMSGQTSHFPYGGVRLFHATRLAIDASGLTRGHTITAPNNDFHRLFDVQSGGILALRDLTVANNGTDRLGKNGGVIGNFGGDVTVVNCTFTGNQVGGYGGAGGGVIINDNGSMLKMMNCTLTNNRAAIGGAIFNDGTLTMTHCTLTGNSAYTVSAPFDFVGGGAIYNRGTLVLENSIVARNSAVEGADVLNHFDSGSLEFIGANIVPLLHNSGIVTGSAPLTADPLLSVLADNGGRTRTVSLLPGSPARNASVGSTSITDQRGLPIVGVPDLGAFEVQGSTVALRSSDDSPSFGESITFTAKVSAVTPDMSIPKGKVIFMFNETSSDPVDLNVEGVAMLSTSVLDTGVHTIKAIYSGDANLLPCTSNVLRQIIKSDTTVALRSNVNPGTVGIGVTFTATVAAVIPSAGTPIGSVVFSIDGSPQPSSALIDGVASFTTHALSTGTHHITASYEGSDDFNTSESSPLVETINGAVALSGTLPRGYLGTHYNQSLTAIGGTGAKTLVVTSFISGGTGLTAPSISADTATLSGTPTGPGTLSFDLTATDEVGASITQSYSLTVVSLMVTSASPTGPGSLTEVLVDAALLPGPDTIIFNISPTQAILVTSPIVIDDDVTLDGLSLRGGVKVVSNSVTSRLFAVNSGVTASFLGFQFIGGRGNTGDGGAIHNNGTLALTDCTLSANHARNGGAIYNHGALTLTRCVLSGNSATSGGSIYSETGGTVTMDRCTVSSNNAPNGGGLRIKGRLTMIQCLLLSNTGHTAAALLADVGSDVSLVHCTITGGYASILGSGVVARGTLRLQHCVLGQNSGPISPAVDLLVESGTTTLSGLNLIGKTTGTVTGPSPISTQPLLSSAGHPLPGSPAIDQAPVMHPALTSDLYGNPRPLGLRPDLGAIEGPIVVTTAVDELDPPGALGAGVSLREAVRDAPAGHTITFDKAVFTGVKTLILSQGPLNPQRNCTLDSSGTTSLRRIVHMPTITAQPQSLTVAGGAAARFAVTVANASGGVSYAWRKNGRVTGITTSAFNITNAQENDEAAYDVVLSEAGSRGVLGLIAVELESFQAISEPASLIVDDASLNVLTGPSNAMLELGSRHALSVVAIGPSPLTYQWRRNGENIRGATDSNYTIINAQLAHAGAYTCVITADEISTQSDAAEIGVVDTRPRTVNASVGGSFTATVKAAGNGLSYAWERDGTTLPSVVKSFQIKPITASDFGLYTCTVTGPGGQLTEGCNTYLNAASAATDVPEIISYPLPQAYIGQLYSWQVPVQSLPGREAIFFNVRGLPPGLTYSTTTGVISGRPTSSRRGGYAVTMRAANAKGYARADTQTLIVNALPQGSVGTFAGPMARSSLNDNLGGRFALTTSATGYCSGSITLGAQAVMRFTHQLLLSDGGGDMILRANIPGITLADRTVLTAYVEVFAIEERAVLTLVHPSLGTTLQVPAWRNPWNTTTSRATSFAAHYTARLDAGRGGTVSPGGYGYTSFTISNAGTLTFAGRLPDGNAISGGSFVSTEGEIALFNLLYATNNRGSHVGHFLITSTSPMTENTLTGTTTWSKPATLRTTSTDTVYKNGFGPLAVTADGGVYVAPAKGAIVPGFRDVAVGQANAKLHFTLGNLDAENQEFTQLLRISIPSAISLINTAVIAPPITNTTKVTTFTASSGLFSGSYIIPGITNALNRPANFYGQLVKIGAMTQGYGYFLLPTATATISSSPKLSGRVALSVP